MERTAAKRLRSATLIAFVLAFALSLQSCAYRLLAPSTKSQQQLRLITPSPDVYTIRVDAGQIKDYQVPTDRRLRLDIPAFRRGCSVYLFDRIRVSDGGDPLSAWTIRALSAGTTVRTLSVREIYNLALDADGYHLLSIRKAN